ncbi:hypothetical protein GCM10010361_33500 [Streptomyces olivaceiscleroticus]|uniref:Uncharacterized protein n=1 Tax=Streptomyces olivaceiscleroticus TaxID=68245 RepID=A0ABN1A3H8_9ACTN
MGTKYVARLQFTPGGAAVEGEWTGGLPHEQVRIPLRAGTTLALYTDGPQARRRPGSSCRDRPLGIGEFKGPGRSPTTCWKKSIGTRPCRWRPRWPVPKAVPT